jgi:hypothetical protein
VGHIADPAGAGTGFTVTAALAYLDTIGFFCWRPLPAGVLGQLRRQYGEDLHVRHYTIPTGSTRCIIQINQPAKSTIMLFATMQDRCSINRIDVAYDFLTPNPEELTAFLRTSVTQKWRRKQRSTITATTAYWRPAKAKRNIALYGDKVSKATGTPCSHLELRFKGEACYLKFKGKRIGNLLELEPIALLKRQTRLLHIKRKQLDRQIEQIARNTVRSKGRYTVTEIKQRAEQVISRAVRDEDSDSSCSQLLWDLCRCRSFRKSCFVELEWAYLFHNSVKECSSGFNDINGLQALGTEWCVLSPEQADSMKI